MNHLDRFSDRDLVDAGMRALRGVDGGVRLLTVMSLVIHGDVVGEDDETILARVVFACAEGAVIGRSSRARALEAFARLGVTEAAILAAATEIVRDS